MFDEYGEQNIISPWITPEKFSFEFIETMALQAAETASESFQDIDTLYLSLDLFAEMHRQISSKYGHQFINLTGIVNMKFHSSVGILTVQLVPHMTNFCFIGNLSAFERLEWTRVGKEFDQIVFGES
jgi:hypothetical protein